MEQNDQDQISLDEFKESYDELNRINEIENEQFLNKLQYLRDSKNYLEQQKPLNDQEYENDQMHDDFQDNHNDDEVYDNENFDDVQDNDENLDEYDITDIKNDFDQELFTLNEQKERLQATIEMCRQQYELISQQLKNKQNKSRSKSKMQDWSDQSPAKRSVQINESINEYKLFNIQKVPDQNSDQDESDQYYQLQKELYYEKEVNLKSMMVLLKEMKLEIKKKTQTKLSDKQQALQDQYKQKKAKLQQEIIDRQKEEQLKLQIEKEKRSEARQKLIQSIKKDDTPVILKKKPSQKQILQKKEENNRKTTEKAHKKDLADDLKKILSDNIEDGQIQQSGKKLKSDIYFNNKSKNFNLDLVDINNLRKEIQYMSGQRNNIFNHGFKFEESPKIKERLNQNKSYDNVKIIYKPCPNCGGFNSPKQSFSPQSRHSPKQNKSASFDLSKKASYKESKKNLEKFAYKNKPMFDFQNMEIIDKFNETNRIQKKYSQKNIQKKNQSAKKLNKSVISNQSKNSNSKSQKSLSPKKSQKKSQRSCQCHIQKKSKLDMVNNRTTSIIKIACGIQLTAKLRKNHSFESSHSQTIKQLQKQTSPRQNKKQTSKTKSQTNFNLQRSSSSKKIISSPSFSPIKQNNNSPIKKNNHSPIKQNNYSPNKQNNYSPNKQNNQSPMKKSPIKNQSITKQSNSFQQSSISPSPVKQTNLKQYSPLNQLKIQQSSINRSVTPKLVTFIDQNSVQQKRSVTPNTQKLPYSDKIINLDGSMLGSTKDLVKRKDQSQNQLQSTKKDPLPPFQQIKSQAKSTIITKNWIVVDTNSGKMLLGNKQDDKKQFGSIQKLMIAQVVLQLVEQMNLNIWTFKITISKESIGIKNGVTSNFQHQDQILIHDLLNVLLIQGADDAAHALADYFGSLLNKTNSSKKQFVDSFVEQMNIHAKYLQLTNTSFSNIYDQALSTAQDIATLSRICYTNNLIRTIVNRQKFSCSIYNDQLQKSRKQEWINNNKLLNISDFFGIMYGFTKNSNHCVSFRYSNEFRDVIVVIIGAQSRKDCYQDALSSVIAACNQQNIVFNKHELSYLQ